MFSGELTLTYNWVVRSNLKISFMNNDVLHFYGAGNDYIRTYKFSDLKPIKNSIATELINGYKLPKKYIRKDLVHLY